MKKSIQSVFALFIMLLAPVHAYTADNQATISSGGSIRFIALPYLHAFHVSRHEQTIIISPGNRQNLSDSQWRISVISIPSYREKNGILQIIDTRQASGPRLSDHAHIIVPLTYRTAPLRLVDMAQKPLWIRMNRIENSRLAWHAPALTPRAVALAVAEQQRKARLAKRMADRAFYFGYDTNNDALK